jgi:glycine cleavage system H protein
MIKIDKYNVDTGLYYDPKEHFWIKISDNNARIGLSPLIQETSGAFVAIQISTPDTKLSKGESFGTIEAEKHVGPLKIPLTGKITNINDNVIENPRLINYDPYGDGWLIEMELTKTDTELSELINGENNVIQWFESELKKFDDKGWIAQS